MHARIYKHTELKSEYIYIFFKLVKKEEMKHNKVKKLNISFFLTL